MNLFESLADAARKQSEEGDFPCWLLADILEIAGAAERYADKTELIEALLSQVQEYDSHAGTGCFGASVGPGTIEATLRKVRQK